MNIFLLTCAMSFFFYDTKGEVSETKAIKVECSGKLGDGCPKVSIRDGVLTVLFNDGDVFLLPSNQCVVVYSKKK